MTRIQSSTWCCIGRSFIHTY